MKPKSRIQLFSTIVAFLFTITLAHNFQFSIETNARDFAYSSWQVLTQESELFDNVKNGDAFLSKSQNDSYETNAGSFYVNSGIRLTALFNSTIIFPDYEKCEEYNNCALTNVREKMIATLPNLSRGEIVTPKKKNLIQNDWVQTNLKNKTLEKSKIWIFDAYPIATETFVSYLIPTVETESTLTLDTNNTRLVTIRSKKSPILKPSISGECLIEDKEKNSTDKTKILKYWNLPQDVAITTFGIQKGTNYLDYRLLKIGVC
jgi:hypothetical protein